MVTDYTIVFEELMEDDETSKNLGNMMCVDLCL